MMNKKMAVIVSLIISINMLSGCAETPETPVVRSKGEDAMERYKEAENLNVPSEKSEMDSGADEVIKTDTTVSENLLQTRLDIPAHYKNEVSDTTGKLNVFTDADLIIPEVETVPAIYVKRHESDQDDIDAITRALFGTVDVYDAHSYMVKTKDEWLAVIEKLKGYEAIGNLDPQGLGTDANGNYVYDLHGEIEEAQRAYETAPEKRELSKLTTPYEFKEELIDPWMPEIGSVRKVYGFVKAADGNSYQYNLTKENNESLGIWAKKIESEGELAERASYLWSEYDSMKMLYSWVPDESAINLGVTKEEAQKMADEKVAALNLQDMQIASSGIVLELRLGYSGKPQEKDMTDIWNDLDTADTYEDIVVLVECIDLVLQKGIPEQDQKDFIDLKQNLSSFISDIEELKIAMNNLDEFTDMCIEFRKRYKECKNEFDFTCILDECIMAFQNEINEKERIWIEKNLNLGDGSRMAIYKWKDRIINLPLYLSKGTRQRVQELDLKAEEVLSVGRIEDVIICFERLTIDEKNMCLEIIQKLLI